MIVFCLLWMPLFCLFWRAVSPEITGSGSILALLMGSIVALVQFFLGNTINPEGFGQSRWIGSLVDIVVVPAIMPLLIALFFALFRVFRSPGDFTHFAILWLIPNSAIHTLGWSALGNPSQLILVPLLWTSLITGIPFFAGMILSGKWYAIIPAVLGIVILPLSATSSYWAFFSQKPDLGMIFCAISMVPLLCAVIAAYVRSAKT
jgi:hypothetical protein